MKLCVLLLLLITYQSFAYYVTTSHIRALWLRTIAPSLGECAFRSGVNLEVALEFFEYGLLPNDPCLKCFFHCNAFKHQVVNATGEINAKHLSENFDYIDPLLAEKCANIVEPEPCQKIYLLVKCLHDDLSLRYL